jgi:hypothetical protein
MPAIKSTLLVVFVVLQLVYGRYTERVAQKPFLQAVATRFTFAGTARIADWKQLPIQRATNVRARWSRARRSFLSLIPFAAPPQVIPLAKAENLHDPNAGKFLIFDNSSVPLCAFVFDASTDTASRIKFSQLPEVEITAIIPISSQSLVFAGRDVLTVCTSENSTVASFACGTAITTSFGQPRALEYDTMVHLISRARN